MADQLSRQVRLIQGNNSGNWLGKSKEEIKEMQSRAKVERDGRISRGGKIPRSKYPRAYQFSLEDDVLYLW